MNTLQQTTSAIAQAIADQVAKQSGANDHGVYIAVVVGGDSSDLFYSISSTANRAHESTRLLCSATSLQRLEVHVAAFIASLNLHGFGLTLKQRDWAASHDWFLYSENRGVPGDYHGYRVAVRSFDDPAEPFKVFGDFQALRAWAGY